jgi:hypothetical protein
MREALNRNIPFDAIVRWWYLLAGGVFLGIIFSLVTGFKPFNLLLRGYIAEGPPSGIHVATMWVVNPDWKDDVLFAVMGGVIACGLIWLLEEIRAHVQPAD